MLNTEKNVQIIIGEGVTKYEADTQTLFELAEWNQRKKKLLKLEIFIDPNTQELVVKGTEKSPITRLRRITGYLSKIDNFNDAKQAEAKERQKHVKNSNLHLGDIRET